MSKRRNLQAHAATLNDLRDVLESMKNLALVEMGKLSRTEPARRHLLEELVGIASACSSFYPALSQPPVSRLFVLVGSERSFCGGFNDEIAASWTELRRRDPRATAIAIGSVLHEKLGSAPEIVAKLAGPAIVEDIDRCLFALLEEVRSEEVRHAGPIALAALAHGADGVGTSAILPFEPPQSGPNVPALERNLSREAFVTEFSDQYVDAALHSVFATSLLDENRARLAHMTLAIDNLDEEVATLRRRIHHLRQEEITVEVETILLSTQGVCGAG